MLGIEEVIIVGSQAILGSYPESELPETATMSVEIDILPVGGSPEEVRSMATALCGALGEFSDFDRLHGFSVDGVDLETAILPPGWKARLVEVRNANTAPPAGASPYTGWCLEAHDLCASKLCALREKDRNFVAALMTARLIDPGVLEERLNGLAGEHPSVIQKARSWLEANRLDRPDG